MPSPRVAPDPNPQTPVPRPQTLPAGRHWRSWVFAITTTIVVVAADLTSKALAFQYVAGEPVQLVYDVASQPGAIPAHDAISVVPYVLKLKLTLNTGAVFGAFKGLQWFFIAISVVAVFVMGRIFWTSRAGAYGTHLVLALILSGALGNLYDRIRFNAVRDMFWMLPDVHLPFGWRWPGNPQGDVFPWIFNGADASLVVGVVLMLIIMWRSPRYAPTDQKAPD